MTDVQGAEQAIPTTNSLPSSLAPPPSTPTPSSSTSSPPSPLLSSSSSDPSLPPFSSALYDVISPALASCDSAISSVFTSQDALAAQIDSLASVLSSFQSLHQSAVFAPYTLRLQGCKKRIKKLQVSVDRINERMDEMREMIRRKEGIDGHSLPSTLHVDFNTGLNSLRGITEKGQPRCLHIAD